MFYLYMLNNSPFFAFSTACSYCSFNLHAVICYIPFQNWSMCWNIVLYNAQATVIKGMTFQFCLCLHKAKISRCSLMTSHHMEDCDRLFRTVLFSFLSWRKLLNWQAIVRLFILYSHSGISDCLTHNTITVCLLQRHVTPYMHTFSFTVMDHKIYITSAMGDLQNKKIVKFCESGLKY